MKRLWNFLLSCVALVVYYLWVPMFVLLSFLSLPITIPLHFLLKKNGKSGFFFRKNGRLRVDIFSKQAFCNKEMRFNVKDKVAWLRRMKCPKTESWFNMIGIITKKIDSTYYQVEYTCPLCGSKETAPFSEGQLIGA